MDSPGNAYNQTRRRLRDQGSSFNDQLHTGSADTLPAQIHSSMTADRARMGHTRYN